jgi:hypothetical protein
VVSGAPFAQTITLEESKVVGLHDLEHLPVGEPLAATLAAKGLSPLERGRDDMNTPAFRRAVLKVLALAVLAATTERDLVDAGLVLLRGDEPNAILEADLGAVLAVELAATLDPGLWFLPGIG